MYISKCILKLNIYKFSLFIASFLLVSVLVYLTRVDTSIVQAYLKILVVQFQTTATKLYCSKVNCTLLPVKGLAFNL